MNFKLETPSLTGFASYSPIHIASASPKSRVTFQKVSTQSTQNFGQKTNKITIKKLKTTGPSNFLASNIITNPSNSKINLKMTPFSNTSQNFAPRINNHSYQTQFYRQDDRFEDNHNVEASPKLFEIKGIKQQQSACKITPISLNAQVLIPVDEQTPTENSTKKLEVGYNHFKKAIATFWAQGNLSTSPSTFQSRCHSAASKRVSTTQITESSSPNPYSRNEYYKKPYQIIPQKQPLSMAKINIESKTMHDSNIVEKSTNVSTNVSRCEKVMFISMDHGHSFKFDRLKTGAEKSRKNYSSKEKAFSKLIKFKETVAVTPRLEFPNEVTSSPHFARVMSATSSNIFTVKKSTTLKHHSASQKKLSTFVNPTSEKESQQIQETFANYIKNKLQRSSIMSCDSQDNSQVETTINKPKSKKVSISLPKEPELEQEKEEKKENPFIKEAPTTTATTTTATSYKLPIMSQILPINEGNKSASPNIETILTSPKNLEKKLATLQRPFTSKPMTTTSTTNLFQEKKPKLPYQRGFTRSNTNQHIDMPNDSDSFELEGWVQDNEAIVEF